MNTFFLCLLFNVMMPSVTESESIGVANLTNGSLQKARDYARTKSQGCIVVLYCGSDMNNAREVISGAQAAKDRGVNVRGVVLAPTDPSFTQGTESFVFYAHGVCFNESAKDATVQPQWLIREALILLQQNLDRS